MYYLKFVTHYWKNNLAKGEDKFIFFVTLFVLGFVPSILAAAWLMMPIILGYYMTFYATIVMIFIVCLVVDHIHIEYIKWQKLLFDKLRYNEKYGNDSER